MRAGDVLVVSPHPDDAVFSLGGTIAGLVARGQRVVVATVFSRAPDGPARAREDQRAIARLGAERLDLGFPELRQRRAGDRGLPSVDERDGGLRAEVARAIGELAGGARVLGPLGVAAHADHQMAFQACAGLAGELLFYEEVPYALCPALTELRLRTLDVARRQPASARQRLAIARWWLARPLLHQLSPPLLFPLTAWIAAGTTTTPPPEALRLEAELHAVADTMATKVLAIAEYRTQWPQFYRSLNQFRAALSAHARRLGAPVIAERLFRRLP